MAFKEVASLDTDKTVALGGIDKRTGKANPTKLEGFYLGTKQVNSPLSKTGLSAVHIFQTAAGNIGVWGKTDLDRKMAVATVGAMTRVTQTGKQQIPGKNPMYKFKVEIDADNTIEVGNLTESTASGSADNGGYVADSEEDGLTSELGLDDEEAALDEVVPARPLRAASTQNANAARQARVQELLGNKGSKTKAV